MPVVRAAKAKKFADSNFESRKSNGWCSASRYESIHSFIIIVAIALDIIFFRSGEQWNDVGICHIIIVHYLLSPRSIGSLYNIIMMYIQFVVFCSKYVKNSTNRSYLSFFAFSSPILDLNKHRQLALSAVAAHSDQIIQSHMRNRPTSIIPIRCNCIRIIIIHITSQPRIINIRNRMHHIYMRRVSLQMYMDVHQHRQPTSIHIIIQRTSMVNRIHGRPVRAAAQQHIPAAPAALLAMVKQMDPAPWSMVHKMPIMPIIMPSRNND